MKLQTRFVDINQPKFLRRIKEVKDKPCLYPFGEGFVLETRRSQIVDKILIFGTDRYRVIHFIGKTMKSFKQYNVYLLEKLNVSRNSERRENKDKRKFIGKKESGEDSSTTTASVENEAVPPGENG